MRGASVTDVELGPVQDKPKTSGLASGLNDAFDAMELPEKAPRVGGGTTGNKPNKPVMD